jgi:hypothetical protein
MQAWCRVTFVLFRYNIASVLWNLLYASIQLKIHFIANVLVKYSVTHV